MTCTHWTLNTEELFQLLIVFCVCILSSLPNMLSSSAANSCYGCSEAGSVTIEGPLRRKTLLKEGRKPRVRPSLISLWFKPVFFSLSSDDSEEDLPGTSVYFLCCSCHRGPDFGSLCLDQHWRSMGRKHWGPLRGNMYVWCLKNRNSMKLLYLRENPKYNIQLQ